MSNQEVIGDALIKYYDRKISELDEYEDRKIFQKEMLSILSKFTFSAILNVDKAYGDTKELLSTLFENRQVRPFYIIDPERIGDGPEDWYSRTQGFHYKFDYNKQHSNIL